MIGREIGMNPQDDPSLCLVFVKVRSNLPPFMWVELPLLRSEIPSYSLRR